MLHAAVAQETLCNGDSRNYTVSKVLSNGTRGMMDYATHFGRQYSNAPRTATKRIGRNFNRHRTLKKLQDLKSRTRCLK